MTSELDDANAADLPEPEPSRGNRRFWRRLFGIFIVFIIGALLLVHFVGKRKPAQASGSVPPAMPVVAAAAKTGDLPIYLNGLGSAVALYTGTDPTRGDGEIFSISLREGKIVAPGDLIAEIDSRPFQVDLFTAYGKKDRGEAI